MRRDLLLCLLGGVVCALSVAPFGWWVLGPLGLAVLAWRLGGQPWRRRVALGVAWGLGMYGVGLAWAFEFTAPGVFVFAVFVAVQTALGLVLVPPGGGRWLGFPAAIVAIELSRSVWPFGGLPLSGIDLGQAGGPLAPLVALGGRLLLVGVVAAVASAVVALAHRHPKAGSALLLGAVALTVTAHLVPRGEEVGRLRVAVVQGGGERGIREEDADLDAVFDAHLAASRTIDEEVDLVLWPEDVVDVEDAETATQIDDLRELAEDLGATVVAGVVENAPDDRFRNMAIAFGPDGEEVDRYEKVHRVPFGEYFPFRGLLERLADIPSDDAIPGPHRPGLLDTPAGRVGVVISYEVFFQGRARSAIDAGGEVLLVPTNASSYTTTQMPAQEVAAARLRAWQTGRDTLQAAPTGFSGVIDARGRVRDLTDLGARQVVVATVARRTGHTPHTRTGDLPVVAATAALLLLAWILESKRLKLST